MEIDEGATEFMKTQNTLCMKIILLIMNFTK